MKKIKKETLESLKKEHKKLCDKKFELYKKGSMRGIAGINQNLDVIRWKIEQLQIEELNRNAPISEGIGQPGLPEGG